MSKLIAGKSFKIFLSFLFDLLFSLSFSKSMIASTTQKEASLFFWVTAILLLLIPYFYAEPHILPRDSAMGFPLIHLGDEPHYFLMLNSFLEDGDWDLKNNYDSVQLGVCQAGMFYAGKPLDRHTGWYINGKYVLWMDVYDRCVKNKNCVIPIKKDGSTEKVEGLPQYSCHSGGMPFLVSFLLRPFSRCLLRESLAILCSLLSTCLALFFYRKLLSLFSNDIWIINAVSFLTFFCTPLWHYSRTFFAEPYLVCAGIMAYYFALRPQFKFFSISVCGLLFVLGILIKPPFFVLSLPIMIHRLKGKKFIEASILGIFIAIGVGILLYLNNLWFGSVWHSSQPFVSGNILIGMRGLLFDLQKGLLWFAPCVLITLLTWRSFKSSNPEAFFMFFSGILFYYLLMSYWYGWNGGCCFGPRMMIIIIPFLLIPIIRLKEVWHALGYWRIIIWITVPLSFFLNLLGAAYFQRMWMMHPLWGTLIREQ